MLTFTLVIPAQDSKNGATGTIIWSISLLTFLPDMVGRLYVFLHFLNLETRTNSNVPDEKRRKRDGPVK